MPHDRGPGPAYWTVGDNWANNGGFDIIEGGNAYTFNQITVSPVPLANFPRLSLQPSDVS